LGNEINKQRCGDVVKIRRRQRAQETLDMNTSKKKGEQPGANQELQEQDQNRLGFLHSSSGG
jgi:hypothetical protein